MGRLPVVSVWGGAQVRIQMRKSDCVQLVAADVALLGNPIFDILRTILLPWLVLGWTLNCVHDRTANLIV
jgi:hypothetical protein